MTASTIKKSMGFAEWAMVIALSLLWGGSFFFAAIAVQELPTLTIVVCRVAIAALVLWAVLLVMRVQIPRGRAVWQAFFVMGFLNNVIPFCLIIWGQSHIASGLASILNATTPLFTVVVAHFLTSDEKMSGQKVLGVLLGLTGVALMIGGAALQSLGASVLAQIAILGAAISYAFASVFGRRFRQLGVNPIATATGQVTASSFLLFPIMLVVDQPWQLAVPSSATIVSLFGLAVLSTVLAYILYFRILAVAGATNLAIVTFLIPVSAILLGILVLGEVLEPKHITGMALIAIGLAFLDGRIFRVIRRNRPNGGG